jgi:hypothetical protein
MTSSPEAEEAVPSQNSRMGGLIIRRKCWTLTLRAKLLVVILLVAAVGVLVWGIHPFLAVRDPVPASVLIIEGWSPPYTMKQAAAEFLAGGYQTVIVLRPAFDIGDKYESGRYSGDFVAALLVEHGVPKERVNTLFPNVVRKDRTYHSALAAKEWLARQSLAIKSLDVATLGPHARRSRLLYEKAFGDEVKIGIIPLDDIEYEPVHWWRSSEGVREVIGESIAYLYARLLFHPSVADSSQEPMK